MCVCVYVQRAITMLPSILSEHLCSLNPAVDRLAFSTTWEMTPTGDIVYPDHKQTVRPFTSKNWCEQGVGPWFGRSIIRSCCRLDYDTAQDMIDFKKQQLVQNKGKNEWQESKHAESFLMPVRAIPTDGHTVDQVVDDVFLLYKLAMQRRKKRYDTG